MKRLSLVLSVAALLVGVGTATASAQTDAAAQPAAAAQAKLIGVGDPAPALKVGSFVKGKEVTGFEKGQVYVVEFWATWCGPCIKAIPHVTELQKKYKDKATFIGVSVWEHDETYLKKVNDFVTKMGDKMDYSVAVDDKFGTEGTMARTWMQATGQDGIPASFIVDGQGRIAWIGHPMIGLEETLEKVVAGTWDISAAVKEQEEARKASAEREKIMADFRPVQEAAMAGDFSKAATLVDAMVVKYPGEAKQLKTQKFMLQLRGDESAAYATAKALSENEAKDDGQILNALAWSILDTKELKNPDFTLARSIAEQAADASKNDPETHAMVLDTLALAQFKTGDVAKAIETQTKAIDLATKSGADKEMISELQGRLDQYKSAK